MGQRDALTHAHVHEGENAHEHGNTHVHVHEHGNEDERVVVAAGDLRTSLVAKVDQEGSRS